MPSREHNYAVDFLRCILMFLVVCTHTYAQGIWQDTSPWWGRLFIPLTYWHVPAFIAISGWFGIHFRWEKFLGLWLLCAFYGLPAFLNGGLIVHRGWSFIPALGWFMSAYLMLMLVAPLLNAGIDALSKQGRRPLLVAAGGVTAVLTLHWFTPLHDCIGIYDAGADKNWTLGFMLMVSVYAIARMIKVSGLLDDKWHWVLLGSYAGLIIVTIANWRLWHNFGSPVIWMTGIAFTGWFIEKVRISERWGILAYISPSMLGVYILHENTVLGPLIWGIVQEKSFVAGLHPCACVILSAVVVFIFCLAIDLVRRIALKTIMKLFHDGRTAIK